MALFSFRHSTKTFSPKVESEARRAQKGQTAAHLRYIARPKAARVVIQERLPASSFAATACVVEDAAQKRKGRVCERLIIALPVEATGTQREDLVRAFCVFMTKQKAGYVAAIHDQSGNDLRNPHAHIVLFDEYERSGGRGRPRSVIGMARKHAIENAARDWAQLHNRMMQGWGYGKSSLIDHRSYAARGLERIPTIHEGPASRAVRAKGKKPNSNLAWKNIDAGQSRADANALIQEINQSMEKLNDPNRLGTHNDKYRDSRKGSVQTSRARRGGPGTDARNTTPPFFGSQEPEAGRGTLGGPCHAPLLRADSKPRTEHRPCPSRAPVALPGIFRRWRRVRRVFHELMLLRDTLRARLSRYDMQSQTLEIVEFDHPAAERDLPHSPGVRFPQSQERIR